MGEDRSGAVWIGLSEVVGFGDDRVLATRVAIVQLLLVGGVDIDRPLGVNQLVALKHGSGSNGEAAPFGVD